MAAGLKILNIKIVNYTVDSSANIMLQIQGLDYTVRGAVRAVVSLCVSTAGLHCKDVSCRRDTSSTEVWVSASCRDLLSVLGSLSFLTSIFLVSL